MKAAAHNVKQVARTAGEKTYVLPAARSFGRFITSPWGQTVVLTSELTGVGMQISHLARSSTTAVKAGDNIADTADIIGDAAEEIIDDALMIGRLTDAANDNTKVVNRVWKDKDGKIFASTDETVVEEGARAAMKASRETVDEMSGNYFRIDYTLHSFLLMLFLLLSDTRQEILIQGLYHIKAHAYGSQGTKFNKLTQQQLNVLGLKHSKNLPTIIDEVDEEIAEIISAYARRYREGEPAAFADPDLWRRLSSRLDHLQKFNLRAVSMKVGDDVIESMVEIATDTTRKARKARHIDDLVPLFKRMKNKFKKLPPGMEDESKALLVESMREGGWKRLDIEATKNR